MSQGGGARRSRWTRAAAALLALLAVVPTARAATAAGPPPERARLRIGLPARGILFVPIFLAAEQAFREEGLEVEMVTFQGGPAAAQALASGSVDVAVLALETTISTIAAGYAVRAFYALPFPADYEWVAAPGTKSWEDLKGHAVAVTLHGSLTDQLTRYVLDRHGLQPGRDVQIAASGSAAGPWQALRSGRVRAAILATPFKWQAEAAGFVRLGTEAAEVAERWPRANLVAPEGFLRANPRTVQAMLRAYVRAVRVARDDRAAAVRVIREVLRYDQATAERAHAEVVSRTDERGVLLVPRSFWEISRATGEGTEPWPEARFLDRTFIDTFDGWAAPGPAR